MDIPFNKERVTLYLSFNDPYSFIIAPMVKSLSHSYKVDIDYVPLTRYDRAGLFSDDPAIRRYHLTDVERFAKKAGRKLKYDDRPQDSTAACLGRFYAEEKMLGLKYINLVMATRWLGGKDISSIGDLTDAVKFIELDAEGLKDTIESGRYSAKQSQAEEKAVADGVTGAPFMVFRGEGFFGADRLSYLEDVIKSDPSLMIHHDASYSVIQPAELHGKIAQSAPVFVLDIRIPKDFAAGHIPGANCLHTKIVHRNLNRMDKDWAIIVADEGGVEASETAFMMAGEGFKNMTVLSGGMKSWRWELEKGLDKWQDKLRPLK
jgi:2-hydroxychromene-2-carboxylate isomerase/rhodanese-related sulfurtransferase